ncbi:MAG: type IV pilus assembly protein PilM [bacterium]|nr:type IV pilus assembly protein PilM [bacterium]
MGLLDFLGSGKPKIAIDLGADSIKVLQLEGSPGNYKLRNFTIEYLEEGNISEGIVKENIKVGEVIKEALGTTGMKAKAIVTGVAGRSVIIKFIKLQNKSDQELDGDIKHEATTYIPFDISEVVMDYAKLGVDSTDMVDIMLTAIKREDIETLNAFFSSINMTPGIVDVTPMAIFNTLEANYDLEDDKSYALINLGCSMTNVIMVDKRVPKFARDIFNGGLNFTKFIERLRKLEFKEAEKFKKAQRENVSELYNLIGNPLGELVREINGTFEYVNGMGFAPLSRIYLCGGSALIPNIKDYFVNQFGTETEILNPFNKIEIVGSTIDTHYLDAIAPQLATGVGLAIRAITG